DDYDKDDFGEEPLTYKPLHSEPEGFVGPDKGTGNSKEPVNRLLYNVRRHPVSTQVYSITQQPHHYLSRSSSINSLLPEEILHLSNSDPTEEASGDPEAKVEIFQRKPLEEKIQSIFDLPEAEVLIQEFPCWLMNAVLLQGHMYVTENFLLYFAHVPHDRDEVLKSGFLTRRYNAAYSAPYWYVLHEHSLAYFVDSTDLYYPYGMLDLKTVVSIQLSKSRPFGFKICTPTKKYSLQTDSDVSLKEWVQALQQAVFRVKNSDHIKIVLPRKTLFDVDLVSLFSFAHTLRLKAVESNFAIDDHHFVFFANGQEAYDLIRQGLDSIKRDEPPLEEPTEEKPLEKSAASRSMAHSLSAPVRNLFSPTSILRLVRRGRLVLSAAEDSSQEESTQATAAPNDSHEFHDVERSGETGPSVWLQVPPLKPQANDTNLFSLNLNTPSVETFLPTEESVLVDFALADGERPLGSFGCLFLRVVPRWGRLVVTERFLCFQSRIVGMAIKVLVPLADLKTVERQAGLRLLHHGLSLTTVRAQELFLEFKSSKSRDRALALLADGLAKAAAPDTAPLQATRWIQDVDCPDPRLVPTSEPMHITCLTIGTRGDVQPYIALCKGLMKHGHTCRIATHAEYRGWIESHHIEFREVAGDPGELIKLCVDNGMFSFSFLREGVANFRKWIDELLETAWLACQGTDVLLESPSAMAGIHIAERLDIPFFGSFPMPWTRTRAFPHPFAIPEHAMGGTYNYMTYVLIEQVMWKGIAWQVNRWRNRTLHLPNADFDALQPHRVPFLYAFSPALVPPPADWHDWIHPTGFWFLDDPTPGWAPPPALLDFLDAGPPPIYIGFGSITIPDPEATTKAIVDAVVQANVRAILCEGWSSRFASGAATAPFPDSIFPIQSVPHDWLFPRVAAVVHHGGSGTTAAGLRAGVPTIIKPFFGDQYFWAQQVERMGAGIYLRRLTTSKLVSAFQAVSDGKMVEKAAALGAQIRREDGVERAIKFLNRDMDYARSRLKNPTGQSKPSSPSFNDSQLLAQLSLSGCGTSSHSGDSPEQESGWYLVTNQDSAPGEVSPTTTPNHE
ncbi:Sterol 3-beta-glucosyltransferase, partial [Massospora cicadina]